MTYDQHDALQKRHPIPGGMVYGYERRLDPMDGSAMRILYAVTPGGDAFARLTGQNWAFNERGAAWIPADHVPASAEYVGYYADETATGEA